MKNFPKLLMMLFALIMMTAVGLAQVEDPCAPDGCRTQTQGGWGSACNGDNPGCIRDSNFVEAFPDGLVIGGSYTITFTSSGAVEDFLSAGGTPDVLTHHYVDPVGATEAGVLAGQLTALALTLGFSEIEVAGFCNLGALFYLHYLPQTGEPFSGLTVDQIFAIANDVLGGNTAALPAAAGISDLNDVLTAINENYVGGTHNNGHLVRECDDEELPVELIGFEAIPGSDLIELRWTTASERDIDYYEIERSTGGDWSAIGTVTGSGDSPSGHEYSYVDYQVEAGTVYSYRLVSHDFDGTLVLHGTIATASARGAGVSPTEYALLQNYPNPFNPTTTIAFNLAEAGAVELTVFDLLGRQVAALVKGTLSAGLHEVDFDASSLNTGVYFYQIRAGEFSAVRKLLLVK